MTEQTKNDYIFFKNEILGDMKKLETKCAEKISQIKSLIDSQDEKINIKIKDLINSFQLLSTQIEEQNKSTKLEEYIDKIRQKLEDLSTKNQIKINILEKDLNNACFKYDQIFSNNLIVPGLIGVSCPYSNLKQFLEYINQKLKEISFGKEKHIIESKKFKEKMVDINAQNKAQFEVIQNKLNTIFTNVCKECDSICKERMNILEKRIESLRLENGQYAFELKQKKEDFLVEWDKLNKIEKNLTNKYQEEWEKYNEIVNKLNNKFEKNKEEFYIIKKKFTEFSEFIKDVRFRKNMSEMNASEKIVERKQYRLISNKIDFSKRKRIKSILNFENQNENEINENDNFLGKNKIHYDNSQNEDKKINIENNNNNRNNINEINNSINLINENKIDYKNTDEKEIKYHLNENIHENSENKENRSMHEIDNKYRKLNNRINLDNSDISLNNDEININKRINKKTRNRNDLFKNNSSEIKSVSLNTINENNDPKKKDIKQKIKVINIKNKFLTPNNNNYSTINYSKKNNIMDNIINHHNKFNNFNSSGYSNLYNSYDFNQKSMEKKIIKENKDQIKYNLLLLSENAKINDLILGADFRKYNLNKSSSPNLSQAYLLLIKRAEEMRKMKKANQFFQFSTMTRNSRNLKNLITIKDLKKSNKEDLYYSTLKKEKLRSSESYPNIFFNFSNKDLTNIERNNFPKLYKDNLRQIDDINNNQKFKVNSHNMVVDFKSVNLNDNDFEEKLFEKKDTKNKKKQNKFLNSSFEGNLPEKYCPGTL